MNILVKDEATMRRVIEHVKIDDEMIEKSDPYNIIDPIWWGVQFDNEQKYNNDLKSFTLEQRYLFAIIWYIAEVSNGGHQQFYFNPMGIVWKDALAGFKALGIRAAAEIIEESTIRMGGDPSPDLNAREKQLNIHQPDFSDLDDRLYELEKVIDLDKIMYHYILNNRNAFYFEGDVIKTVLK